MISSAAGLFFAAACAAAELFDRSHRPPPLNEKGLMQAHPLIEIEIVTGMNTPVFKMLKNEELDAGIIGKPPGLPAGLLWRQCLVRAIGQGLQRSR